MPEESKKISPAGAPFVPGEMAERLRSASEQPEAAAGVQLRLTVTGGHADERYDYRFEASGAGALSCDLHCRMTQRDAHVSNLRIERGDFVQLLRTIDVQKLIEVRRPLSRIPPCSLVGRFEIHDGVRQLTFLFMADPGQAESAGFRMPPELERIVEQVYSISAKYLRTEGPNSVRP
jgi:hypothetical protein